MSSTELFQKTKRRMIKQTVKMVKRRKVPRLRRYNEQMFGKRTLRIFDVLYQMAEIYSTVPGMIFRENKYFLQEWSFVFLQELFRHRHLVNQRKLKKKEKSVNKTLKDSIPLLNCDEVIDDLVFDISPTGDPEDEHDDIIPGKINPNKSVESYETAQSLIVDNFDNSSDNDSEVTLIHKENFFQNVSVRPRKALPVRIQLSPEDSVDLPLSSTKFESFSERSMFPIEMSVIDNTRSSPTMDQTTIIKAKTPKMSPNSTIKKLSPKKKTPTSASSSKRPTRGRSKIVLSDIVNTNNNLDETDADHDSTITTSINTTTQRRTTRQKRKHIKTKSEDNDYSTSDITIVRGDKTNNETYMDDSTAGSSMLNQTHNYSLRDRSMRINYKAQCGNTSISHHKRTRNK